MKRLLFAAFLGCATALSGCASQYSSLQLTGGYQEKQLGPETWTVSYAGNGFTTNETAQTFWLYRAAELTLQKGYDGFTIVSAISLISFPADTGSRARTALYETSDSTPAILEYVQFKPGISANIRMLKNPFNPNPPRIFDAKALKAALEPIVKGQLCELGNVCPHVHGYLRPPL